MTDAGGGAFVNTITAGIIIIIKPFDVMKRPIMKDLIFYELSLIWIAIIFYRRKVELWSSLGKYRNININFN